VKKRGAQIVPVWLGQ